MSNGNDELKLKLSVEGAGAAASDLAKITPVINDTTAALEKQTAAAKANAASVQGMNKGPGSLATPPPSLNAEKAGEEEINALLIQRQAIESTLAEAAALEAAGRKAEALALREEAEMLALALRYQQQLKMSEAESLVLARERLVAERAIEAAKAAEVLTAKAAARAEAEQAAAAKLNETAHLRMAQTMQSVALRHVGLGRAGGMEARGLENMLGIGAAGAAGLAGVAIATAAVIGYEDAVHHADEELRKMHRAGVEDARKFAVSMQTNPVAAFATLEDHARKLHDEIEDLGHGSALHNLADGLKAVVGIKGDAAKTKELGAQLADVIAKQREAMALTALLGEIDTLISSARAAGNKEQVQALTRELELEKELAIIRAKYPFDVKGGEFADDARQRKIDAESKEAYRKYGDANRNAATELQIAGEHALAEESDKVLRENIAITEKLREQTVLMGEQAGIDALLAAGMEDEAASLKLQIALGKEWMAIQEKLSNHQIDQQTADDAKAAALAKFTAGQAVIEKKKQDAWKTEQERMADDDKRDAEKEARQAERDDARLQQMRDRGAELHQQLAGETDAAKIAEVQLKLNRELAEIRKTMAPERQAEAADLAKANALLDEQIIKQKALNKAAGEKVKAAADDIGDRTRKAGMTARQISDERDAAKRGASAERAAAQNAANKWAADERKDGRVPTDADIAANRDARLEALKSRTTPDADPTKTADALDKKAADHSMMPPASDFFRNGGKPSLAPGGPGFYPDDGGGRQAAGGRPMSEADIAGDAGVQVDTQPVADAQQQAAQGMGAQIVQQIADALAGAQSQVQIDTGAIASAVQSATEAVRSDLQSQIDDLASQISALS